MCFLHKLVLLSGSFGGDSHCNEPEMIQRLANGQMPIISAGRLLDSKLDINVKSQRERQKKEQKEWKSWQMRKCVANEYIPVTIYPPLHS